MNRFLFAAAISATAVASADAHAGAPHRSAGSTGIGLGAGTWGGGVSAKHFLSQSSAVQGVVGIGDFSGESLQVNADYLVERPSFAGGQDIDVAWNFGAGAGLALGSSNLGLGISGIVGIEFALVPVLLDLVLEYRPTIGVLPGLGFDPVNFTGHLRWFF
jgi:hypothetical protein